MTVELAEYLIGLDKYVIEDGLQQNNYLIDIQYPMNFRLTLISPDDLEQSLLVDIKESEKKSLKISLHHQDDNTQSGLLRVDFNSRHLNPVEILPTVPAIFHPYAGVWLDNFAGHIHYVVDGYKPLAWAIPLEDDTFPTKQLNGRDDYANVLQDFFQKINLKTNVSINIQMRIL